MSRLREGRANTARGAAHFLRETVGRVRYAGANGRLRYGPTAGSTLMAWYPSAARWMSASPSPSASTRACAISSRRYPRMPGLPFPTGWTVPPMWPRPALPSSEPDAAPVRLIVRRVKPTPGSQLALFATYSYHGFITDRDGEMLELEADHRRHAEIENAIRDLKHGVGLNHLPSGRFAANAAWLAVQVMAHNIARWTARIGLGEQVVTTKTLRPVLLPGRTDHSNTASATALALGSPDRALARATPCLTAAAATGRHPGEPNVPANSRLAASSPRYLALTDGHKVSPRQLKTDTGPPLPQIVPGPSPSLAPIARSAAA